MIQKNFNFLKRGLLHLGFGKELNADLEKNMTDMPDKFQLKHAGKFGDKKNPDRVDFSLDFKKSDTTDLYHLNRHTATLRDKENPENDRTHTFYIHKNNGVTSREAYNLLQGRAVNKDMLTKDGRPYNAWIQLDFNEKKDEHNNYKIERYFPKYGFDLEKSIKKYSMGAPTQDAGSHEELLRSLSKGDRTEALHLRNGKLEKVFIEANPVDRNLNIYSAKGRKMDHEKYLTTSQKEKEQKNETDDSPDKKQRSSRRQGMSVS
jgi:hypothetical protein